MKVFYGIEDGYLYDGKGLADENVRVFETPLLEEYITHIDFDDDFADELQRVFVDVNRENFFNLAVDPNSVIAKYGEPTDILTLDYNSPELTAFLMDTFQSCVENFVVESRTIQVFVEQGKVALWFYVEGYYTGEQNCGSDNGYVFSVELTEDEIALLYKLVW